MFKLESLRSNEVFNTTSFISANRLFHSSFVRSVTDVAKYPKITTHYTINPRDKDERWKGKSCTD